MQCSARLSSTSLWLDLSRYIPTFPQYEAWFPRTTVCSDRTRLMPLKLLLTWLFSTTLLRTWRRYIPPPNPSSTGASVSGSQPTSAGFVLSEATQPRMARLLTFSA